MRNFKRSSYPSRKWKDSLATASDSDGTGYMTENSFGEKYYWADNHHDHNEQQHQRNRHSGPIHRQDYSGGSQGSSPAISALGLLAFLFFLNMIQNSLVTNSLLTMRVRTNSTNSTTVIQTRRARLRPSVVAGRGLFDNGFQGDDKAIPRIKRSSSLAIGFDSNHTSKKNGKLDSSKEEENGFTSGENEPESAETQIRSPIKSISKKRKSNQMQSGRRRQPISIDCIHHVACRLGRRLYDSLGNSVAHFLRSYILPNSGRFMSANLSRALSTGLDFRKSCKKLERKCKGRKLHRS